MYTWNFEVAVHFFELAELIVFGIPTVVHHIPAETKLLKAINAILAQFASLVVETHVVHPRAKPDVVIKEVFMTEYQDTKQVVKW